MANRQSIMREAGRSGHWLLRDIGRELRVARLTSGLTQRDVATALHTSISHVSRAENGRLTGLGVIAITRHAAAVGLKPWVRLYPGVARPLDRAQLELIDRFRRRIGAAWTVKLEATMPIPGDLRAADATLTMPGATVMVEAITRLADFQAQLRAARRKQRDIGADRLLFLLAATTTNRRALAEAGSTLHDAFPLTTRTALSRLAANADPGGDAIVLV